VARKPARGVKDARRLFRNTERDAPVEKATSTV
jgi:hypothetical protein